MLYIASDDGTISQLDTTSLDALRTDPSATVDPPTPILTLDGPTGEVVQLVVVDDQLVARTSDGWLAAMDPANAVQTGTLRVPGAVKAVRVPSTDQVVVDQTKVADLEQETNSLATALAEDASLIRPLLQGRAPAWRSRATSRIPTRAPSRRRSTRASSPASRSNRDR